MNEIISDDEWNNKYVMNLFSWKRGGMQGILLLFKNVFNIDQYFCRLVRGLANLLDNLV